MAATQVGSRHPRSAQASGQGRVVGAPGLRLPGGPFAQGAIEVNEDAVGICGGDGEPAERRELGAGRGGSGIDLEPGSEFRGELRLAGGDQADRFRAGNRAVEQRQIVARENVEGGREERILAESGGRIDDGVGIGEMAQQKNEGGRIVGDRGPASGGGPGEGRQRFRSGTESGQVDNDVRKRLHDASLRKAIRRPREPAGAGERGQQ